MTDAGPGLKVAGVFRDGARRVTARNSIEDLFLAQS